MSEQYHYEIWQDGIVVVSASGCDVEALRRDMVHYASQYAQDGPIQIRGSAKVVSPDDVLKAREQ